METKSMAATAQFGSVISMPQFNNVTGNVTVTVNNTYGQPPSGLKAATTPECPTDGGEMLWTSGEVNTPVNQNEMLQQELEHFPIQHSDDQEYVDCINSARQQPCTALKTQVKKRRLERIKQQQESLDTLLLGYAFKEFFYGFKPKTKMTSVYSFFYVSPIKTLKRLLSDSAVFDMINTTPQRCKQEGFLCNTVDGSLFKSHPLFLKQPSALQIIIFADEVEIMPRNKLLRFYYMLANIYPKYRSEFTAPLAAANVNDIDEGGVCVILQTILKDFKLLHEGVKYKTPNGKMHVFGAVVSLCSKTLKFAGFKGGGDFVYEHTQEQKQGIVKTHTTQLFKTQGAITDLLKSAFKVNPGKNRKRKLVNSSLFKLVNLRCDLIQPTPHDVMDIIAERVVPMEIKSVLKHLIMSKQMDLNWFNSAMLNFPYSSIDMRDKPDHISVSTMSSNDDKLQQSSGQMLMLLKIVPFLLNSVKKTPYVQLVLDLRKIIQRLSAPVFSVQSVATLKKMIEEHLKRFKELFPSNNIIPEQHYMLRLPAQILSLGPLVWYRSRRLEPDSNLKNVVESVLNHTQHFEYWDDTEELGPVSKGANMEQIITKVRNVFRIDGILRIEAVEWLRLTDNKYIRGQSMVITNIKRDMPVFGLIENIYVMDSSGYCFECRPYETLGLDKDLLAYEVVTPDPALETQFVNAEELIDHTSYFPVSFKNHEYVQIQYNLDDVIALKKKNR